MIYDYFFVIINYDIIVIILRKQYTGRLNNTLLSYISLHAYGQVNDIIHAYGQFQCNNMVMNLIQSKTAHYNNNIVQLQGCNE